MSTVIKSNIAILLCFFITVRPSLAADNLLLVTIDGLRWQEVFRGLDPSIVATTEQNHQATLFGPYEGDSAIQKREKLMPFLWQIVAKNGVLLGNRDQGSNMQVTNERWFSYPGYNELLTGKPDPAIVSNDAIPNPNITFLEWLNQQANYRNKVAVFGSWDAFNAIINDQRSGIMTNSGFQVGNWSNLSAKTQWLNELQKTTPSPWSSERLDAFTYGLAVEYIKKQLPKVIYIALGETDEFAHHDNYAEYLNAAKRNDYFIAQLWTLLQGMEQYRNNTNLLITVDHGRGQTATTWQHHASVKAVAAYKNVPESEVQAIQGSEQTWLAGMGPDVKTLEDSVIKNEFQSNQVASTALSLLGINAKRFATDIGKPLPIVKEKN